MATTHTKSAARAMMAPSVIALLIWMAVPLAMTLYYSTLGYSLYNPISTPFVGFANYSYFLSDPTFAAALINTLILVVGVLCITVIGGILVALLLDQDFYGVNIVRLLVIAPFFVMPTVAALVWIRPPLSVSGTRCTRWTPLSNLSLANTPVPVTFATISLKPPTSLALMLTGSTFQPCSPAKRSYMR